MSPEVWSRVDAARVLMAAAQTVTEAGRLRADLALVLADAVADGEDVTTIAREYAQARAAHVYAGVVHAAAQHELDEAPSGPCRAHSLRSHWPARPTPPARAVAP